MPFRDLYDSELKKVKNLNMIKFIDAYLKSGKIMPSFCLQCGRSRKFNEYWVFLCFECYQKKEEI